MKNSELLLIFGFCIGFCISYPTNIPPTKSVCRSMVPGHGPREQTSDPPFNLTVSSQKVKPGGNVEVNINALEDDIYFKGFYVQAKDKFNNPVGSFLKNENIRMHSCNNIKSNACHHVNPKDKNNVKFYWKSPKDLKGKIVFTATIVREFREFWTNVKAEPVIVENY